VAARRLLTFLRTRLLSVGGEDGSEVHSPPKGGLFHKAGSCGRLLAVMENAD